MDRCKKRKRGRELEALASGDIYVLGSGGDGHAAEFVQPGHECQRADQDQAGSEGLSVVQFHQHTCDRFVCDLKAQFPQIGDLLGRPFVESHLLTHIFKRFAIVFGANKFFFGLSGNRVKNAIPIGVTGSFPERERAGGSWEQLTGRQRALLEFCVLCTKGKLVNSVQGITP